MESVVVQTDDVNVGEPGDLTCGTADTAPDVENPHSRLEAHLGGEVVLVAGKRSFKSLAPVESGEVEGLGPSELIQLGSAIVVACTS